MKTYKLPKNSAFCTANSTDKHAVVVDGYFGLFGTSAEADQAWSILGGEGGNDCGDTPFGYCQQIPPAVTETKDYLGNVTTKADLVNFEPIDIVRYIQLRHARSNYNPDPMADRTPGRILEMAEMTRLWGAN